MTLSTKRAKVPPLACQTSINAHYKRQYEGVLVYNLMLTRKRDINEYPCNKQVSCLVIMLTCVIYIN